MSPAEPRRARWSTSRRTTDGCSSAARSSISPTPYGAIEQLPLSGVFGAATAEAIAHIAIGWNRTGKAIQVLLQEQFVLLTLAPGGIRRKRTCGGEVAARCHCRHV